MNLHLNICLSNFFGENNIWNRCQFQLHCCNLWNQLITPDFVSLRVYSIFLYLNIKKRKLRIWSLSNISVLFSIHYAQMPSYYLISVKEGVLQIKFKSNMTRRKLLLNAVEITFFHKIWCLDTEPPVPLFAIVQSTY